MTAELYAAMARALTVGLVPDVTEGMWTPTERAHHEALRLVAPCGLCINKEDWMRAKCPMCFGAGWTKASVEAAIASEAAAEGAAQSNLADEQHALSNALYQLGLLASAILSAARMGGVSDAIDISVDEAIELCAEMGRVLEPSPCTPR